MKLNKLYIAILLFAGILTSCKVGKSYVRLSFIYPVVWLNIRIRLALESGLGRNIRILHFGTL